MPERRPYTIIESDRERRRVRHWRIAVLGGLIVVTLVLVRGVLMAVVALLK